MFKIRKIVSALIISSLILLLITACAELDSHSNISRFQQSEDLYQAGMRWGEWSKVLYLIRPRPESSNSEKMITKVNPDNGKKYQVVEIKQGNNDSIAEQKKSNEELLIHLDTIKVAHTEILSSFMNDAEGTGESRMLIEYRFDTSAKIRTLRYTVSWWHDEQSNTWFTDTPLPKEFEKPIAKETENKKRKTIKLSPKRY